MSIQFYTPKGLLKDFVDYIGYLSGPQIGNGIAFPRMNQVIIINLGSNFQTSDIYNPASRPTECNSTIWMNGKQDTAYMLGNPHHTSMYAIGLKLGMLPYFANLPAIETNQQTVGAEHWTSKQIFDLREQLQECPGDPKNFERIETYLTQKLIASPTPNLEKIRWIAKAMHTSSVEEICRTLGTTRKQLRQQTQHYFGGSVKNIQGIIRLNRTLADIAANADKTLSSIHEYYDQSHFINDFKARTGITPLQYKRLCGNYPEIKITPNFIALPRETFLQFISR